MDIWFGEVSLGQNKDGMEEDLDAGGTDIPDQASSTSANETDDKDKNDITDDHKVQTWYQKM